MKIIAIDEEDIEIFKKFDPLFMLARTSVSNRFLLGGLINDGEYDEPVALMICVQMKDSIIVEWLYVEEEYRMQGLGNELFEYLVELAADNGIKRIESYFVETNPRRQITPNDERYFMDHGLINTRNLVGEWITDVKTLMEMPAFENRKDNRNLVPLNMMSKGKKEQIINKLINTPGTSFIYGYDEDYLSFEDDLSYILIDESENVYGALLSDKRVNLIIPVAMLATDNNDAVDMAQAALMAARDKYGKDIQVCIQLAKESTRDKLKGVLPMDMMAPSYALYADISRFISSGYEQITHTAIQYDYWSEYEIEDEAYDIENLLRKGPEVAVTVNELSQREVISKAVTKETIHNIGDLDMQQIYSLLVTSKYAECYGAFEDLPSKPDMRWFDSRLSCSINLDDEIRAILLVNLRKTGEICPILMYAVNKSDTKYLLSLIKYMSDKAVEVLGPDTKVVLRQYDELSRQMSIQIFGAK